VAGACVLGLVMCAEEAEGRQVLPVSVPGVRVIGASPGLDGSPVALDGVPIVPSLPYRTATPVVTTVAGQHTVTVGPLSTTVDSAAGCVVNVVVAERPLGSPALVPADACHSGRISDGAARLSTLIASDEPGRVEVTVGDAATVEAAPFRLSDPVDTAAGRTSVVLRSAVTSRAYTATTVDTVAGTALLAVFAGGGDEPFRLFFLFDGAQPASPPHRGDINTGLPGVRPSAVHGPGIALAIAALAAALVASTGLGRRLCSSRRVAVTALLAAVLAAPIAGCAPTAPGRDASPGAAPRAGSPPRRPAPTSDEPAVPAVVEPDPAGEPSSVRIPRLALDAPVVPVNAEDADVLPDLLAAPDVAWFRGTATPGTVGTAVIAGHVGRSGSFGQLAELRVGDELYVVDTSGTERRFVVRGSSVFGKGSIPEDAWGPVRTPTVVLITCAGPRRSSDGLHRDNLVVWATS
jgi:sortase (surface protein transpeptidase)